jgi:bifunctional non-homologous end joining protein LigD
MDPIAAALERLPCREAIIDGEVAAPDKKGVTRVADVRGALSHPKRLAYFAFDLLWLDGEDLRGLPLVERKRRLEFLLRGHDPRVLYVEHVAAAQGQALYDAAIALGCEGIVSKRPDSRYAGGPTRDWIKIKPAEVRERQAEQVRASIAKRKGSG